jgi:hypothetical protein
MQAVASGRSLVLSVSCLFWVAVLVTATHGATHGADSEQPIADRSLNPFQLDLSAYYVKNNDSISRVQALVGQHVFEGLPFDVGGQIRLYGESAVGRQDANPHTVNGIRVDRKFAEIHLVHHAMWPDVHGEAVAHVSLNYTDGTRFVFPICYGLHVRDWFNLPSYGKETVDDPSTTICWRGEPVVYNAPVRIFKSKIKNPRPEKMVDTMDLISGENLAVYNLLAATVTDGAVTDGAVPEEGVPEVEQQVLDRDFDAQLNLFVVDDVSGTPLASALVMTGMEVEGFGVISSPLRTTAAGEASIAYPKSETESIWVEVKRPGYQNNSERWGLPLPEDFTIRLKPIAAAGNRHAEDHKFLISAIERALRMLGR